MTGVDLFASRQEALELLTSSDPSMKFLLYVYSKSIQENLLAH